MRSQAAFNSNLIVFPSAVAALANVVRVRLVSLSSSRRFKAALLVCIFLAMSVFVSFCFCISCSICHVITRFTATAVECSRIDSSFKKESKLPPICFFLMSVSLTT